MDRDEERRIIAQVCAGDANAFEALVVAYQKQVYNLALRTVGNEEDAADMTQEVFLRAYRALGTFRGESKFSVWLYRLTTNVCIDFLRSRRRHPTVSLTASEDDDEQPQFDLSCRCGFSICCCNKVFGIMRKPCFVMAWKLNLFILAYLKFSVKVIPLRMACKRRCGVWMTVDGCGLRMYFR